MRKGILESERLKCSGRLSLSMSAVFVEVVGQIIVVRLTLGLYGIKRKKGRVFFLEFGM